MRKSQPPFLRKALALFCASICNPAVWLGTGIAVVVFRPYILRLKNCYPSIFSLKFQAEQRDFAEYSNLLEKPFLQTSSRLAKRLPSKPHCYSLLEPHSSPPNASWNLLCIAAAVPRNRWNAYMNCLPLKLCPDAIYSPLARTVLSKRHNVTPANSAWSLLMISLHRPISPLSASSGNSKKSQIKN